MKSHIRHIPAVLALSITLAAMTACSSQTAEEKGKELATSKIDVAKGIGDAMQEKGEAAGEAVTHGVGKIIKGFEKGVSKSGRAISADASLGAAGLKITILQDAASDTEGKVHALEVYILSSASASGKLKVTAFDVLDREIAHTSIDLKTAADEGKYHTIPLDAQVALSAISKVAFEFNRSAPAVSKAP